jgi:signal peptidase I
MENTLQVGDRIAVNKFGALFTDIKRGEVVVFSDPDKWLGNSAESEDSGLGAVVKTGLITVGVLPDPAKQYLIKRVIGVGGDKVVCCDKAGKVQVNGVSITEPYVFAGDKPSDVQFNVDIPKGFIWVMGDHRGASADSRFHPDSANNGMVPLSKVVGRAVFVVWPFTGIGLIPKGEDLKKIPVKNLP